MFFGYTTVEKKASSPPLLPQKSVLQGSRKQRRLSNISSTRVVFVIVCALTVVVWWLQAFQESQSAHARGTRFEDDYFHASSVLKLKRVPQRRAKQTRLSAAAAAFQGVGDETSSRCGSSDAESDAATASSRSLAFQVCNGFANQRLSIIYAAIIAKETGRSLYLPRLLLDGTQHDTSKATTLKNSEATEFRTFYDVDVFVKGMKAAGVCVIDGGSASASLFEQDVEMPAQNLQSLLEPGSSNLEYRNATHLSIECPLFKLDAAVVGRHRELFEIVLSSLVPAPARKAEIESLKMSLSKSGPYNFLHMRIERDWIDHCKTWVSERSNCLAEEVIRAIGEHLDLKGVPRGTPMYVACDLPTAEPDLLNATMRSLQAMGYKKVKLQGRQTKGKSKEGREDSGSKLDRELRAMHAYFLGMDSEKYIGNSVSTFSALLLLERQNRNSWSTYYNMGGIPLMDMLPFFRMPWVFTYNGESPSFDYMAKSAVLSAIHIGHVVPYCIYMGDKSDEMYQWLKRHDVHVVLHDPSWKVNIVQQYDEAQRHAKIAATYESITSLVATFMRFDIPIIHALFQYNYALYTDIDVLFLKKIDLHSFPPELPEALVMSNEVGYDFPCNAGVVLYNLPYMRQSYNDLVTFAMHAPGLHFGEHYGPADQGALNQFYERELGSECNLPEAFNAKPYKLGDFGGIDGVFILHFHGPKPKHYLDFARDRGCGPFLDTVGGGEFVKLCQDGLKNLCEVQLEIPEIMRSKGSWGPLSDLQSSGCDKLFPKL